MKTTEHVINQIKKGYIKRDNIKHIVLKFFFSHQQQDHHNIEVKQIRFQDNLADFFMNLLPKLGVGTVRFGAVPPLNWNRNRNILTVRFGAVPLKFITRTLRFGLHRFRSGSCRFTVPNNKLFEPHLVWSTLTSKQKLVYIPKITTVIFCTATIAQTLTDTSKQSSTAPVLN